MKDVFKLSLRLLIFTVAAGLLLALTNAITEGPIAAQEALTAQSARQAVLPEAASFEAAAQEAIADYPSVDAVYRGVDGDVLVGYAFELSPMGFKDEISLTLGVNAAGAITGLNVNGQSETVGLGARIASDEYLAQYKGVAASANTLDDHIDGLTGATVSSRAVANAVSEALAFAEHELGVVGTEDKKLAAEATPTAEDLRRMALIEGGRHIYRVAPYAQLGYACVSEVFEVALRGGSGYVLELTSSQDEALTLAVDAQGVVRALTREKGEASDEAFAAFAARLVDKPVADAPDEAGDDALAATAEAVSQGLDFYRKHLAAGRE